MIKDGGTADAQGIYLGVRRLIGRAPTENELALLCRGLAFHREVYANNEQLAAEILSHGAPPQNQEIVDLVEDAAFMQIALVLLNMDETITKE